MAFLRRLPRGCAGKQLSRVVGARTSTTTTPACGDPNQKRQIDPLDLKFNDHEASFKSKTMTELLRAYVVYGLCSFEFVVENNMKHFQFLVVNLSRARL